MSAYQILEIEGVDGESLLTNFEGKIQVDSYSFGVSCPSSIGSNKGGGVAKANFSDLSVSKSVDTSSGALFKACASSKHFDKATLHLLKGGGDDPVEYLKYELGDVMVTSYQVADGSGGSDLPRESMSLAFNTIQITYTPQADDGSGESPTPVGWDIAANKSM